MVKFATRERTPPAINRRELSAVCALGTAHERKEALTPLVRRMLEKETAFASLQEWQKEIMALCAIGRASEFVDLHVGSGSARTSAKGNGPLAVMLEIADNVAAILIRNIGLSSLKKIIEEDVLGLVMLLEDAKDAGKIELFLRSLPVGNILERLENEAKK